MDFPVTNWQTCSPQPEKADPLYDLKTKSFSQLSLLFDSFGFLRVSWPFPVSHAVNFPDFATTVTVSFVHLSMQDETKGEFFLQPCRHHLQDLIHLPLDCRSSEPLGMPSLALLLPFLTSGPDLGTWPDCWVSVDFLRALILRKGSGITTITTNVLINTHIIVKSTQHFIFSREFNHL